MLHNIKLKPFLFGSFALILIIMNFIGLGSLYFNRKLADATITFYEKPHTVQLEVGAVQLGMSQIGSQIKEALIYQSDAKTGETTKFIADTMADLGRRIEIVKRQFAGDQSLILKADNATASWAASIDKMRAFVEARQFDEAIDFFISDYLPAEDALSTAVQVISDDSGTRTVQYYESAKRSKVITTIAILTSDIVAIIITLILCSILLKSILIPLKEIRQVAESISKGDLKQEIKFKGTNEFGRLAESMRSTVKTLSSYIGNIDSTLEQLASKDLTNTINIDYIGDFAPIKESLEEITDSLNLTISQMNDSAELVASGAAQVANSSQISSQAAEEQASSVEELAVSVSEISHHVTDNAAYAAKASDFANEVGSQLLSGNKQMDHMLVAISEINSASDQIAKIIKTIEDIAFQTNILALNAAIEAARAGEAGKGFAVVADEVRDLAGKSADAAKSTTELIKNSINAVENGTKIANGTADTLKTVVEGASQITQMIDNISVSSKQQADSLEQINVAVNQITQTIQTNSAATEECAATSQEMNGQAACMAQLVAEFKLRRR